ncbi:MAG: TolC family protein [Ignavibacteriaceae bacterium]|nr:TolC family protein [Ignavibacteriaceae bacterium]
MNLKFIFLLLLCSSIIVQAQQDKDSIKVNDEEITLQEAVDTALVNNPNLKAFVYEISSLEKQKIQAGLIPNPEADFEAEDFLGGKELIGIKGSQYTLSASQLFELGGKRSSRINLAETEIVSSRGDYELLKLDVIANVKSTFFSLYQIQKQIEQQRKFVELNEEILKTISERVKAGRTSPAEESKVKVALTNSRIELDRLQRSFSSIQAQLNSLLGTTGKNLIPATALFDSISVPPTREEITGNIEEIPSIKLLQNEVNIREAALELERSLAVPDLTVNGGVRYLNELKTNSFVAGVSIPLPFFNRNQGNIQAAEVRLEQMDAIKNTRRLNVIAQLNTAYNNLLSAYNNSQQLKNSIIPEAENAYEVTRQGYIQGRFAFIDLLDAQRTLFETQTQFLLELSDYYNSLIEIENITGINLIK